MHAVPLVKAQPKAVLHAFEMTTGGLAVLSDAVMRGSLTILIGVGREGARVGRFVLACMHLESMLK